MKKAPGLWLAALCVACAPKPSAVPLGLGPLALAEQAAAPASALVPKPERAAAASAAPAPEKEAELEPDKAEASTDGEEEAGEAEAGEETEAVASAPDGPVDFPGLYAGEDVAVFRLPGLPEREEHDDKAKIRIEKASGGNVRIVLVNSADGSDLCTLSARVEGNTALVEKAQPCFGSDSAQVSSGRAVLEGDTLTMDAEGTIAVSLGEQDIEGELSYTFQGQRQ